MNDQHPLNESEWQAQERARRNARLHLSAAADDAGSAPYRLLAQALRETPMPALPADFARNVAQRALAATADDGRLERAMTAVLGVTLGLAGAVTALHYGAAWWEASASLVAGDSASAAGWIAAVAGCMGLSWLAGRVRPLARSR